MICPICKSVIKDESKFCGKCGSMIPRCPTCGRVITKKSKFCASDGTPLPEEVIALFETASEAAPKTAPQVVKETVQKAAPNGAVQAGKVRKKKKSLFPVLIVLAIIVLLGISITAGYHYFFGEYPWETIMPLGNQEEETEEEPETQRERRTRKDKEQEEASKASEKEETMPETAAIAQTESESSSTESSPEETSTDNEEDTSEAAPAISMSNITAVTATSSLSEQNMTHLPSRVIDGDLSTAWVEGASGQGIGESIHFTFDDDYLVTGLIIHAGYQKSDSHYRKNSRPKEILVEFYNGGKERFILQDTNSEQNLKFHDSRVVDGMAIYIESVYEGDTYEDTCISEVSIY